jgi:hypothetical protein
VSASLDSSPRLPQFHPDFQLRRSLGLEPSLPISEHASSLHPRDSVANIANGIFGLVRQRPRRKMSAVARETIQALEGLQHPSHTARSDYLIVSSSNHIANHDAIVQAESSGEDQGDQRKENVIGAPARLVRRLSLKSSNKVEGGLMTRAQPEMRSLHATTY